MRARNAFVLLSVLAASGSVARADKTTDELAAGYTKEAAACTTQANGVAKVADGAAQLQASLVGAEREALDADLAKLAKGRTAVDAYCAELASALELLAANPGAKYKTLERQLDEHDNKIRRARADSKRAVTELEPVIHALVPRINARVSPPDAPPVDRRAPVKFPSGRTVVVPPLPGTWRLSGTPASDTADYAEAAGKATPAIRASVWTRPFDGATCEQERRTAAGTDDVKLTEAARALGVTWMARGITRGDIPRAVAFACLPGATPMGGFMAYVSIESGAPGSALRDALDGLMIRMLAAQAAPPAAPTP